MISIKKRFDHPIARRAVDSMRLYITAAIAATAGGVTEIYAVCFLR